jgi:hypothetical protein
VTIKGGTVKDFGAYGVRLAGVQRNHVVDMQMDGQLHRHRPRRSPRRTSSSAAP